MSKSARSIALPVALLLALAGCDAVPDIYFVSADGAPNDGASGDGPSSDGAPDSAADGPLGDGAAVCPTAPPPGTDTCCGVTPCKGACTPTSCTKCGTCPASDVCCAKTVNAICKAPSTCN